jgi:hypothetical protein
MPEASRSLTNAMLMKHYLYFIAPLLGLTVPLSRLSAQSGNTTSLLTTETEIIASGRFVAPYTETGIVILDRLTGEWRRGDVPTTGAMTWTEPASSGLDYVTEASVGLDRSTVAGNPNAGGDMIWALSTETQRTSRLRPGQASSVVTAAQSGTALPTGIVAYGQGTGFGGTFPTEWS